MIAVFAILGIYPFGKETVMTGDTTYQLVDYLSYYKTVLFGNNDFSYSLSKNMGGEMAGFAAYYLYSPLNLLTLPFPKEYLFAGIGLIIAIVPGFASLSMCYALRHIKKDDGSALIFSLCYGLSAYIIVYNELIYYYTNIILLPILFLLFRKMMNSEYFINPGYFIILGYAVINNYYTGYMICIFLLIYAVYYLFGIYEGEKRLYLFLRFAVNSVIAALLSCITLIPAIMSLSGEKDNLSVGLYICFPPLYYFSKLYTGSFAGDFGAGMPNIYCGILITILLIFILISKDISRKKRVLIGSMLVFFWADFFINTFNVVWHGFNQPIGFPYRQSFLIIFFCILTVYEETGLLRLTIEKKQSLAVLLIFSFYSAFIVVKRIDNTDILSIIVSAVILILLIIIFSASKKNRLVLIGIVTVFDLTFNAGYSLSHFYLTSMEEYQDPLSLISSAVDNTKKIGENDVYRMEKTFRRTNNDAMMSDYAGLTHFSSSEKKETMRFLGSLGFRNNGNWAMYTSTNTALADSLLGVRYIMSEHNGTGKPYDSEYSDENEEYYIYRNPYAIPIMSAVESDVFDVSLSDDPFENQNLIADSMSGKKNNILRIQKAERIDGADGSVSYDIEIKDNGILYGFFSADDVQEATLYNDGDEWSDYFSIYDWSVIDFEERKEGDKVRIDIKPDNEEPVIVENGYFAIADDDSLADWSKEINKEETVLYKKTSSCYKGNYNTEKGTLLFSIPMDRGWHLYVDGKETALKEACGHMMGASVPPGKHEVTIRFIPPGRNAGIIISLVTLIGIMIYCGVFRLKPQYIDRLSEKK